MNVNNSPLQQERVVFADYIRVIACFLVMLVHSSENFYGANFSGMVGNMSYLANDANRFWVGFYDGFVARTCVPLFILVSAFLLVPMKPGMTMSEFYKRRFRKILPPFFIFMLLYSLLPMTWGAFGWDQAVNYLKVLPFNFPDVAGHLWFMYPLISLYLIIPVVSPWLEKSTAKEELTFIALFLISSLLPFIHEFLFPEIWGECFWNGFHAFWYCSGYLGYLVIAHYVRVHMDWSRRKRFFVGLTCFLAGSAFTLWSFWWRGVPGQLIETPKLEWAMSFCTPNLICATFGAFLMFTCIGQAEPPRIITKISKLSFNMYLMHMFFLAPVASFFVNGNAAEPRLPVWLSIPLIALISYVCCVITAWLISLVGGLVRRR